MTRWQGMTINKGFFPIAVPTARTARGRPIFLKFPDRSLSHHKGFLATLAKLLLKGRSFDVYGASKRCRVLVKITY